MEILDNANIQIDNYYYVKHNSLLIVVMTIDILVLRKN